MSDHTKNFGKTAKSLGRSPLGIIALFIVLVYGFASLVTVFAGSLTSSERLPLIYFLITFPVLVLGVFSRLVSKHSSKLFAPSDFKDEENYVKIQMAVVASLHAAIAKGNTPSPEARPQRTGKTVRSVAPAAGLSHAEPRPHGSKLPAASASGVRQLVAPRPNSGPRYRRGSGARRPARSPDTRGTSSLALPVLAL